VVNFGIAMAMVTVPLEDISKEGLEVTWEEEPSSLSCYMEDFSHIDFHFETALRGAARIWKVGRSIMIKGTIQTTLGLECVRCLEAFTHPLVSSFELTLFPSQEAPTEEEKELEQDDMELGFYEGGEIHLSEIACEQVFLEIPYQPLCRENCIGLCPVCGKNLNQSSCECKKEELESGFAALKKLKLTH